MHTIQPQNDIVIDELEAPLVALIAKDPAQMTDDELSAHLARIRALRSDGTKRAAVVNKGAKTTKSRDKLSGMDDLLG
jgi:hypothetical protein